MEKKQAVRCSLYCLCMFVLLFALALNINDHTAFAHFNGERGGQERESKRMFSDWLLVDRKVQMLQDVMFRRSMAYTIFLIANG